MPERCLLYYITDRTAFAPDEPTRRRRLLEKIAEAARSRVDFVQLREKDLSSRELEALARDAVQVIRQASHPVTDHIPPTPALLINSRSDIALAVDADGVHLRSGDISPQQVRNIWSRCVTTTPFQKLKTGSTPPAPLIAASCRTPAEVIQAAQAGANLAVFAPVFEKKDVPSAKPSGVAQLRQVCQAAIPVLALGGVTLENAKFCLEAGAAGIAGIRLFQQNDLPNVVYKLHNL